MEESRVDDITPVASAATPATLSDIPPPIHEHVDEVTGLEPPEQLLTPENSRSETSSNNENASSEEKPALRRRTSTRVTRASMRTAQLETPETDSNDNSSATNDDVPVNGVVEGKKSQSSQLRHSIAVMESSLWGERTGDAETHVEADKHTFVPDTPISESSQETPSGEVDTSLQQRTLRKRVGRSSAKGDEGAPDQENDGTAEHEESDEQQPLRRSSRRSILEKASGLVDRDDSVLGKRTRSATKKDKEPDWRSSLRPRKATEEESTTSTTQPPATKKRRVSDSDLPAKKSQEEEEESTDDDEAPTRAPRYIPKRWLAHGLYSGQEPTDAPPVQSRNKTSRRRSRANGYRKLLPLPMFAGDRLLQNGRDFQLPFDIFSPLPPGQPKPNEWRKTNKSTEIQIAQIY